MDRIRAELNRVIEETGVTLLKLPHNPNDLDYQYALGRYNLAFTLLRYLDAENTDGVYTVEANPTDDFKTG